MLRVRDLFVYPVKGVRAVSVSEVELRPRGPAGDRRWIITDETGQFLSQRTHPRLALISATLSEQGIMLSAADYAPYDVSVPQNIDRNKVVVWRDSVAALDAGDAAAEWLSSVIGTSARLYYMDDTAKRTTSGQWGPLSLLSFADGYPLLVTNTASLVMLNEEIVARGGKAVSMDRFRANIVIESDAPWAEDGWRKIRIGAATIQLVKPCVRCQVTLRDQITGALMGTEPLRSLAELRRDPELSGVTFGWNAIITVPGQITVEDRAEIL